MRRNAAEDGRMPDGMDGNVRRRTGKNRNRKAENSVPLRAETLIFTDYTLINQFYIDKCLH